jgi:hypothetical protein
MSMNQEDSGWYCTLVLVGKAIHLADLEVLGLQARRSFPPAHAQTFTPQI